jgi:hypothetical protein
MMSIEEMIAVLQAAKEGKSIQLLCESGVWVTTSSPQWNFRDVKYRVKPEPRTFYAAEFDSGVSYLRANREEVVAYGQLAGGCKTILTLVEVIK